jgi:Cytochrome b562
MSRKSSHWMLLAATAVALAGCATVLTPDAGQAPAPPATAPTGRGRGPTTPANLSGAMREMGAMLKTIQTEAADPAKSDQTLKDLTTFERDVAISKLQAPPYVNRLPTPEEKAKELESYRVTMNALTRALLDLEDAVVAKKPDDIKKSLDLLAQLEKQGHAEFHVGGQGG